MHIVLEGVAPNNAPLVAVGYKYNKKKVILFICTRRGLSTRPGKPYEMKFTDTVGNVCIREVERPDCCSIYFNRSNILDTHNQLRQSELALEKKWITNDPYFRLKTTHDGVDCIDTWLLSEHHGLFYKNSEKDEEGPVAMSVRKFAGVLAQQILEYANRHYPTTSPSSINTEPQDGTLSTITHEEGAASASNANLVSETPDQVDTHGLLHTLLLLPKITRENGKIYRKQRECQRCKLIDNKRRYTSYLCGTCNKSYCIPTPNNGHRSCFSEHVFNCGPFTKRRRAEPDAEPVIPPQRDQGRARRGRRQRGRR